MRCERLRIAIILTLLLPAACSRETPAPARPSAPTTTAAPSVTTDPAAVSTAAGTPPARAAEGSYDEALLWFRSTNGFRFTIDESGVHAEGELTRKTIGAESVTFTVNGEQWRATAGEQGVRWERRSGSTWTGAAMPAWGNRLYQRVTVVFDPQKREGSAQLAGSDGTANHYRFTNANTGEVHEVWVSKAGNHIERMKIGTAMELKITGPRG
jgi:hypothetical protein